MSRQFPLPLPHEPAMAAEDFLPADSNREALAWVTRWPDWPHFCLTLSGPAASGKTHLLRLWLQRSGGMLLTPDNLSERGAKNVAIDKSDSIAGQPTQEEALFHLYNHLKESGGSLLLAASAPPAQWGVKLPDLRSRLSASLVAPIDAPDDALLSALLVKQFHDRQIGIQADVVDYLLPRIERSAASVTAIAEKLDAMSLAESRKITVALARRLLENS